MLVPKYELSSRPERTRISCHAALDKTACAALRKESRMKFANATKFYRKSGGAQWRDLLSSPVCGCFGPDSCSPTETLQN